MLSTVQLALIIWQTLSGAQDVLVQQSFLDIFIVIVAAVLMHGFYLAFNAAATVWVLRMPLKEAIAATIMSSQKSAPVAVTVIRCGLGRWLGVQHALPPTPSNTTEAQRLLDYVQHMRLLHNCHA